MMQGEFSEVGPSTPTDLFGSFNGSRFEGDNEGLASEAGASVSMDTSITDITLDKALSMMKKMNEENILLKDHLVENNKEIKQQCEVVRVLKQKDKEKVDKFKALVSSLKEEVKELQVKVMTHQDKEKENDEKLATFENENAHLLRQKALNEQRVMNILKHAQAQGLKNLDDVDDLPYITDAVFVSTEDKEKKIESLEANLMARDDVIVLLRNELLTVNEQRDQYKFSNDSLLKDMEGMQRQKETLDRERRQLQQENANLSKELDRQMQSTIASAKKEIVHLQGAASGELSLKESIEILKRDSSLDTSGILDDAENLEELFEKKLTVQQTQKDIENLKLKLDAEKASKKILEDELDRLKSEYEQAKGRIDELEKARERLNVEYQENLNSITQQHRLDNSSQQAKLSEDQSALRSQVISLLGEVDDLNNRLSTATFAIHQKDRRIKDLGEHNEKWKTSLNEQWHQSNSTIQALQTQLTKQQTDTQQLIMEQNGTRQQYQALQENFNKLVTDYTELLETFEAERNKVQKGEVSKETMEQLNKVTAQVIAAEEAIGFRDKQLNDYKRKFNEMTEKNDILLIQIDTYKTDFDSERNYRAQLSRENQNLSKELKKTQDQLKEITAQLNKKQMEEMQRRVTQRPPSYHETQRLYSDRNSGPILQEIAGSAHAAVPTSTGSHNDAAHYQHLGFSGDTSADQYPSMVHQCPSCGMNQPDADTLQLHVPECLDKQHGH